VPFPPFFNARASSESSRIDLTLLQNSHIVRCRNREVLNELAVELEGLGYLVRRLHASLWVDEATMHRDLAAGLGLPDYYGHNLDALNDMFRDLGAFDLHGTEHTRGAASTGTVLAVEGFETFTARMPRTAHLFLDMFAVQARAALLGLHPMLCLVESTVGIAPVGATDTELA
jgi:hypothetical protein